MRLVEYLVLCAVVVEYLQYSVCVAFLFGACVEFAVGECSCAAFAEAEVAFEVLMLVGDEVVVGAPVVDGVSAKAEVLEHGKGKKVIVFKYKPKKNYRKKQGHRQPYTKVKITAIG